jgi:hypothetical protein
MTPTKPFSIITAQACEDPSKRTETLRSLESELSSFGNSFAGTVIGALPEKRSLSTPVAQSCSLESENTPPIALPSSKQLGPLKRLTSSETAHPMSKIIVMLLQSFTGTQIQEFHTSHGWSAGDSNVLNELNGFAKFEVQEQEIHFPNRANVTLQVS